ncbi:MAG: DMT family transporter, partial [Pseudomonadota bacterium]|nr:DMT family transporter [Pseudomonadota bacterium]
LTVGGILSASAANITQAMDGAKRQPFLALLAWSMAIGVAINSAFALATAGAPQYDPRPSYALGILYLGLAGSVVTFPLYYGLVRKVGAGKAAYSSVIVPVVAMVLSTLFEGFVWGPLPIAGAAVTLVGMVVAMRGRATPPPRRATPEP